MERIFFWGFVISALIIIAKIMEVTILKAMGIKKKKIKDKYVLPLWLGMSVSIAMIPSIVHRIFSLNGKMSIITFFCTVVMFGVANIEFWSRVDEKGE